MKNFPNFISTIPDDILLEIFSLLSFETLHECRWVSKSWHSLITHQLFAKIIKSRFLGFFHGVGIADDVFSFIEKFTNNDSTNTTIIEPGLDFLPCCASQIVILDCCNGLILYESWALNEYYVGNPMTRSWVVVECGFYPACMLLDFDPWVSPYFSVIAFAERASSVFVSIYCSETKRWVNKGKVNCGVHYRAFQRFGHCTLWNGALYVGPLCSAQDDTILEEGYKIIRFVLSESNVSLENVKFPRGTKMPMDATYIGRLGNNLCFAGLDGLYLRVWNISPKHENRWVIVHKGYIRTPRRLDMYMKPQHIVGFHPLRMVVFIFFERVIFAYDLVELSCVEICRPDRWFEAPPFLFPFLTCSSTLLENRIDHQSKKIE